MRYWAEGPAPHVPQALWPALTHGLETEKMVPVLIDRSPVHGFERAIDMPVSGIAPAAGAAVVFFAGQIGTCAAQQGYDFFEAPAPVERGIDARTIVQILPVEDRGAIDFTDGRIHLAIGLAQVAGYVRLFANSQKKLGNPQVASGAEIRGMTARGIGVQPRGREGKSKGYKAG